MNYLNTNETLIQHAHQSLNQGSKSFALAAKIFARPMRDDVAQLYAWCRHCDDVIDDQVLGGAQNPASKATPEHRLETLYQHTRNALQDSPDSEPVFLGMAEVFAKYGIPNAYAFDLLDGFAADVAHQHYETLSDLMGYCYGVAGSVGVMMAYIMGAREEPTLDRACDLGLAFQLTNIARDVAEDARAGRVYLPAQWLREAGAPTEAEALQNPNLWPSIFPVAQRLLATAETYYHSASTAINHLPLRCAWAVNAGLKVYREIGRQLLTQGPEAWAGRIHTGTTQKLTLALTALPRQKLWPFSSTQLPPRPADLYQRPSRG